MKRLTREEVLNEIPGQRLNAWAAENVISVPPLYIYTESNTSNRPVYPKGHKERIAISDCALAEHIPNYSTNISEAWQIVETLNSRGWPFFIEIDRQGKITASTSSINPEFEIYYPDNECFTSVPEAICKVALLLAIEIQNR